MIIDGERNRVVGQDADWGAFMALPEFNELLVMDDDFHRDEMPLEVQGLFDHAVAEARFGASVFWVKPSALIGDQVDDFVAHWQVKRDSSKRGIIEVVS
jgi:hypothetical protein